MKIIDFLFPPLCLHCQIPLASQKKLFCTHCALDFKILTTQMRCPYCFVAQEYSRPCESCFEKKKFQVRVASALEYSGAVCSLVKKLKKGEMSYLAKTGAAFLLMQFTKLQWPVPDLIMPVPSRHLFHKKNHAYQLAFHLAKNLRVELSPLLKRVPEALSQAKLSKHLREQLAPENFYLSKNMNFDHKNVLLIDDVFTTGTTLRHSAQAVWEGYPKRVFGLTLAHSRLD